VILCLLLLVQHYFLHFQPSMCAFSCSLCLATRLLSFIDYIVHFVRLNYCYFSHFDFMIYMFLLIVMFSLYMS